MGEIVTYDNARTTCPSISLRLLHATQGHALQTWNFEQQPVVQIGRLESGDVAISDPRVSRLHAELRYENGGWQLIAHGRNGVLVDDRLILEPVHNFAHERVFQLGPGGPLLEFLVVDVRQDLDSQMAHSTIEFDFIDLSRLGIDRQQAAEQVQQITKDDNFRKLLEKAQSLRSKRVPPSNEE